MPTNKMDYESWYSRHQYGANRHVDDSRTYYAYQQKIPVMRFIALLQTLHRINNVIPLVFRQTGLFESHVNNLRVLEK